MVNLFALSQRLPLLASCVIAAASFPSIPSDLTTPFQQRLAINGPNGESVTVLAARYSWEAPSCSTN